MCMFMDSRMVMHAHGYRYAGNTLPRKTFSTIAVAPFTITSRLLHKPGCIGLHIGLHIGPKEFLGIS